MKTKQLLAAAVLCVVAGVSMGQTTAPAPELPLAKQEALVTTNQASFVIVEYTLQYDKGDAPQGSAFTERCPNCGKFHGEDFDEVIKEERPLERAGLLVEGNKVVTADMQIHPRFVKGIRVRRYTPDGKAEQTVSAVVGGYAKEQNAVVLELGGTLEGAKAAAFDGKRTGPYSAVSLNEAEGRWVVGVHSFGGGLVMANGKLVFSSPAGLVVDKDGGPVGVATGVELRADGAWKGSPAQWPTVSASTMAGLLKGVEEKAAKGIVTVTLNFRSPKGAAAQAQRFGPDEGDAAVQHVLGVVTGEKTVLVLAELKPSVTARLERIRLETEPPMDATFKASLTDYGAFVAETEKGISGGPVMSEARLLETRATALPTAEIYLQGEKRVVYTQERRIASFTTGWRGNVYPEIASRERGLFLFDGEGKLLALPVAQRQKASAERGYRSGNDAVLTPVMQVAKALGALKENSDPNNVPLTEAQESRLAWVGVELQALTPELARANNVSDQTNDGATGSLVTFVYPESPAGKAGVEAGWVFLRVDVEGEPKPIEVQVENDRFGGESFPWDRLGDAPETVYERIPQPWPGVETPLIRALTDLGFGKKYVAEFAHEGKVVKKEFTVSEGPASYDSAPRYKHEGLGVTVRDMTYEVRRYMQKGEQEPGVILSKIELGSKGSISGLKPYEVITHVNDQPVANVKEFEKLAKDQAELRLSVKRMTKGRIVKVTVAEAAAPAAPAVPAPGGNSPPN